MIENRPARQVETFHGVERRSWRRYPIHLPAVYHRVNQPAAQWPATIIDLSAHGLRFTTPEGPLQTGEWITVLIAWPARCGGSVPVTLLVHGVVARSSQTEAAVRAIRYEFEAEPCGPNCACRHISRRPAKPEPVSSRQLRLPDDDCCRLT